VRSDPIPFHDLTFIHFRARYKLSIAAESVITMAIANAACKALSRFENEWSSGGENQGDAVMKCQPRWLIAVGLGMMSLAGCEKQPTPPVPSEAAPQTQPSVYATSLPTTQELLGGSYKEVSLTPLPFKAKIPQSWKVEMLAGTSDSLLHGPGPTGNEIRITLNVSMSLTPDRLELLLQGAKRSSEKDKDKTLLCEVRKSGEVQILEMQRIIPATTQPADQPIDWKLTYFVPHNLDYESYSLNVLGMSYGQYGPSKELLRKIFDSVTYNGPGNGL
jgi:hypothetical protein